MNTRRIHSRPLLALLLLVAGLAGAMRPQRVAAQNSGTTGPLNWNYDAGTKTLSITGSGDMPDFAIFMNQPWGAFREQIETVTIGAGVTSVGKNAFLGCTALTAVTLPSSVTTIGAFAFVSCKALTGITIPSGVKTIKESVFFSCTALTSVTLPEGLQTIGASAFLGCSLTNVTLPNSVTTMGESAFSSCTALTNVTLSDKLTTIEERVFNGCSQLKNVTIPNSVTSIGKNAFAQCTALKNVNVFWDTPLTISADAFQGIELNKVKLYVPAGKTGAYQAANVWKGFDVQEIPGGTLSTGLHWQYIPSTKTLSITGSGKIPDYNNPQNRPWHAFRTQIETVTIGAGVSSVGKRAFWGCRALKSVTLPAGLQTLGESAFDGCSALTRIELPAGLKTLGVAAFAYCSALKDVTVLRNTPLTIPPGVFGGITPPTSVTLHVPGGTGEAYQGKDVWKELTIEELPWGDFDNGLHWAYDAATRTLTITNPNPGTPKSMPDFTFSTKQPWKAYRGGIQKVTIGAGVNHVGAYAFTNCEKLTSVTLPAGLKEIEKNAFSDCSALTSITLPEGIQTIREAAFYNCAALASISIPNSVTAIADGVFASCKALKSVTLPDGLQTIGKNAFLDCAALVSISIPKSVTTIGSEAFSKCSALKDVTVAWETPLPTYTDVFNHLTLEEIRLHVPEGKIEAYKAANVWEDFIVMSDRGDLAGGLKWQMDATYTLTIINPTPGSPKPMPDFANPDEQPWESFRSEIQAVTIEDGVSSVGKNAFVNCYKMTHVTLPKSVTTIREGAFAGCNKMTHVTLPADAKLDTIGKDAFIRCTALTSISLPKSKTTIEDRAFSNCEALTSVTLPADGKLQTIGVNAFGGCVKLKSITIPNSVTKIESGAFSSCKELTSVTLPDNAQFTKIESDAFQYCKALERITIPNHVDKIKTDAFNGCTALASATLPKSVTKIESQVFKDCKALKDLTVAWTDTASIPNISLYVFQYTPPATVKLSGIRLHVPHGTVAAYQSKDVWKEFTIVGLPLPPTPTPPTPTPTPTPKPQLPDRPSAGTKIGGLTLSATNFTLNGERTFRFTITITPADAADKRLSVSSSDETVVRVRILPTEETRRGLRAAPDPAVVTIEGTVCGLGKAKIHVKSTDGSNLTATCHVDVRALPTANIEAPATRLYTAAGHLHLTLPTATAVNVYNLTGTLVRTFIAPAGTSSIALSQGVYVVRAGTHTEKVFVD